MKIFPIDEKKVCFDSFEGTGFGGDPKYICLELVRCRPDLKIIWFVRKKKDDFPKGIKQICIDSIAAVYHQSTAKVWVDNTRTGHRTKKRSGQYYLQTWHGQVVSKKIEKDAEDKLWSSYIPVAKYDGSITDAVMASNEIFEKIFRSSFWLSDKTDVLRSGSPSNDVLFLDRNKIKIRKSLGLSENEFVLLYAPTFRDDSSVDGYIKDYSTIIEAFQKKVKKKCVVLLRYHPDIAEEMKRVNNIRDVIDVTLYPDIKDLSIVSDFIITDYSSIISDFILLKRPGLRYCSDIAEYIKLRGMYDTFYELPYEIVTTEGDLRNKILNFDFNGFNDKLNQFLAEFKFYDDGYASLRAVDWINKSLKE